MVDIKNFLYKTHIYHKNDCITLIRDVYKELGIDFSIPSYSDSKYWMLQFSPEWFDSYIMDIAIQVPFKEAKNYDVLVFKHKNKLIHFGLYLEHNKMLHIEEQQQSCVSTINSYWKTYLHGVYRHNDLV